MKWSKESNEKQYYLNKLLGAHQIDKYDKDPLKRDTELWLGEIFMRERSEDIVYDTNEKNYYVWKHGRWNEDTQDNSYIRSLISPTLKVYFTQFLIITFKLTSILTQEDAEYETNRKLCNKLQDQLILIERTNTINCILKEVKTVLQSKQHSIKFDITPNLMGFNNKTLDLDHGTFRDIKKTDHISMTTNYDWKEPTEEKTKQIEDLMEKIFPNPDVRQCYTDVMYSALWGGTKRHFTIANGAGGNGKSLLNELLMDSLGDYGYNGHICTLTDKPKSGANPELANLHKKRLCVFKEPGDKEKMYMANIKTLVDNKGLNARMLYKGNCEVLIFASIIMECNWRLLFEGKITEGDRRRLIDLLFESTFTDNEKYLNDPNRKNTYKCNPQYKQQQFRDDHRSALIRYIINYGKSDFTIPPVVVARTEEYINSNSVIFTWVNDNYELVLTKGKPDKTHYVRIRDMYDGDEDQYQDTNTFIQSDEYKALYKKERPTLKEFNDFIEHHQDLSLYYQSKYQPIIDGKAVCIRKVLMGYRRKVQEKDYKPTPSNDLSQKHSFPVISLSELSQ